MFSLVALVSCDLDLFPETGYNEGNVEVNESTESQYNTREEMLGLRRRWRLQRVITSI